MKLFIVYFFCFLKHTSGNFWLLILRTEVVNFEAPVRIVEKPSA